jgi:outer membrane protein OmpA-like peptidoglycan-associated protein
MTKAALFAAVSLLVSATAGCSRAADAPAGVVYFTEWSALLDDAARGTIQQAATLINKGSAPVTITGYADVTGSTEANRLVSTLRAQMVIDQLVADGVPATRLRRADRGATPDIGGLNESRRVLISIGQ